MGEEEEAWTELGGKKEMEKERTVLSGSWSGPQAQPPDLIQFRSRVRPGERLEGIAAGVGRSQGFHGFQRLHRAISAAG